MSYSRWSNSIWYTYWSTDSLDTRYKLPTKKTMNSQVFTICDMPSFSFTYGELQKEGAYVMIKKIKKYYSKSHEGELFNGWKNGKATYEKTTFSAKSPSEEQMLELLSYIRKWEKDVEDHFSLLTFFKYEWVYPIRNKIFKHNQIMKQILKFLIPVILMTVTVVMMKNLILEFLSATVFCVAGAYLLFEIAQFVNRKKD